MERLTDKNHNAINKCGEYSSCYSCHKEICYIKELEEKLGELEDVLEKYGIESAEELDGVLKPLIDNGELENWKSATFWKMQTERLKQELAELKQKAIVPKFQIGQTLYMIPTQFNGLIKIKEYGLLSIDLSDIGIRYHLVCKEKERGIEPFYCASEDMFGKSIFATKEEARKRLEELKGE